MRGMKSRNRRKRLLLTPELAARLAALSGDDVTVLASVPGFVSLLAVILHCCPQSNI